MKKLITSLFCIALIGLTQAQSLWKETKANVEQVRKEAKVQRTYTLDLASLRNQLKNAPIASVNAQPILVSLPSLNGKMETYEVFSAPVMEASMANQYQLGSYVGRSIDDKFKSVRFSISPYDFQCMSFKNGQYEFIEPLDANKTVYGVFEKSSKTSTGKAFECSTTENALSKEQISRLIENGSGALQSYKSSQRASDQKIRTMRLALSVTAEYTQYFGGVPQALAQMNATMTRVNGVLEKDMSLRLVMVNNQTIIYTDPTTDPYTGMANWNIQLQTTLNNVVGDANYDIGHLFGGSGGGGNAGCIGCVCESPIMSNGVATTESKGSGYTSPSNGIPMGDTFDIDYVAHEIGHQLGANHTFSHNIEGTGVNVEPGSGSTIMGYAGITSADVQSNSDAYFHAASISQMQDNLISVACDVETTTTNLPPVIVPMADITIPKGTAFHLTAVATDPDGDAITYNWEQMNSATSPINATDGQNINGANFRSFNHTTIGKRFFPKYANVLDGYLSNDTTTMPELTRKWEAVSNIAKVLNFRVTVRDNNATAPQSQFANQKVTVGNDGPFKFLINNLTSFFANINNTISWSVANTNTAPYNAANVMLHYSTDNGATWIQISASTPNNGTFNYVFPASLANSQIRLKVEAIGNVFYAISPSITVKPEQACTNTAPTTIQTSNISNTSADITWSNTPGATYNLQYRLVGTTTWTTVNAITGNTYTITGLTESKDYEYQIATVCSGTAGAWSVSQNFSTINTTYCPVTTTNSNDEYISQVKVNGMISNSGQSNYTDYFSDAARAIELVPGTTNNTISVTKAWTGTIYTETVHAWIDFNRNGLFDDTEKIMATTPNQLTPEMVTFTVPASAPLNQPVKLRVMLKFLSAPTGPCTGYTYGEIEDYKVTFKSTVSTSDIPSDKSIQVYPNPADDVINITKVSDKATYSITSVDGRLISNGNVKNNKVNVSQLVKGVYMININNEGKTQNVVKFIKK